MPTPTIEKNELRTHLNKIKPKKATGPDTILPEMYKVIRTSEQCMEVLQKILQNIYNKGTKIHEWERSTTKMIPKLKKPTAAKLRPIALTDISYKLFMSINGQKIENHIIRNGEQMDTQAGFTTERQIEDNLFILQYCIEQSYIKKKPLIVTCIDYSKAFDSIKRETIIETLMHYRIHPDIIEAIANIYQEDYTQLQYGDIHKEIGITSGIRQGCTGSTILFKLVTYMIMSQLEERGRGYQDENIKIKSLFFADDGLLLAHSIEEAKENLEIVTNVSREFGLEINREKSNIIIFRMKDQPENIASIDVVKRMKYLGIVVNNTRNCFKFHKKEIIKKARKMANMTFSIIEKSSNKLMIGKTYRKSIALPTFLHGNNILNITIDEIKELQKIENSVYRTILNAPKYAPNVTLRGDIGSSTMRKRIINSRFNYMKSIQRGRNKLLEVILENMMLKNDTRWMQTTNKYMIETGMKFGHIRHHTKDGIKRILMTWDDELWKRELHEKTV